jgi:quinone-modifying oxidoreductase subunit QmoC
MAPTRIEPDLKFVNDVISNGGDSLKKGFQCATCSVTCELSPDRRPFPRKEMIWAQWGLKDRLLANPDVWLCHQCNDCSTKCPRDAKPGDVMASIRKQSIINYSFPSILGKMVASPKFIPVLFLIPAILLGIALAIKKPVDAALQPAFHVWDRVLGIEEHLHEGVMVYSNLFPHWLIIGFFSLFAGLAFLGAAIGVIRLWKDMHAADTRAGNIEKTNGLIPSIIKTLKNIVTHNKLSGCTATKSRFLSHLGVFYGFMGLLIVTVWAIIVLYIIQGPYPFPFSNPMKLFGNLSGLAVLAGAGLMLYNRFSGQTESGKSTNFDWTLLVVVLTVVITGFITQFMRFAGAQSAGYTIYFFHLIFVFYLLIYLPYSKFAHVVYRTVAMVYAEVTGRDEPVPMIVATTGETKEEEKKEKVAQK